MFDLFFNLIILILAFVVVVKSSHILISACIEISKIFGIGKFAIGFILVSVATSLPELSMAINAGLLGEGGFIMGNAIGADITDILWVLGLSALVGGLFVREKELIGSAEILFLVTLIPLILLIRGNIAFVGGLVLIAIFLFYVFFIAKQQASLDIKRDSTSRLGRVKSLLLFGFAVALLLIAANFAVSAAVNIANLLDKPSSLISLTIVSFGTTLPELVVNISSIRRGQSTLALGNILGSCVTNLTLVLGVGALLTTITINMAVFGSGVFFLIASIAFLNYVLIRYKKIDKRFGLIFVIGYVIFLMSEVGLISIL